MALDWLKNVINPPLEETHDEEDSLLVENDTPLDTGVSAEVPADIQVILNSDQ